MDQLQIIILMIMISTCTAVKPCNETVMNKLNQINAAQNLWKAGCTEMSPLTNYEFSKYLGQKSLLNIKKQESKHNTVSNNGIPNSFDSREQWPQCPSISSIKDQGHCGDGWAVATAASASDRLCIGSNFLTRVNLSAENLLSCCLECAYDLNGCLGGDAVDAWRYIKSFGIVTGGDFGSNQGCQPYSICPDCNSYGGYTPPCYLECTNNDYDVSFFDDLHFADVAYILPNLVDIIQYDILINGPLVTTLTVFDDFLHYENGVYVNTTDNSVGYQSVKIIGWGTDSISGVDYWLAANSWNTTWGENGFFKIRRGTNECGFEDYVTAGLITK